MKIGILTLPLHTNYGGILQAYALQTVLERMGHEPVHFNKSQKIPLIRARLLISIPARIIMKYVLRKKDVRVLAEKYYNEVYDIISKNTQQFIDQYVKTRVIRSFSDIKDFEYDAFIVGSDQVWRPKYFMSIEDAYLKFAAKWECKRVAYAASFGTDIWEYTEKQTNECKSLIKKFDAVSVREYSGVKLVDMQFNVKAIRVLDPTMLLSSEDYNAFVSTNDEQGQPYLLVYILDMTKEKKEIIEQISKKCQLKIRYNSSLVENSKASINERIQIPVGDWICNFKNASYVFTDSYHATVFSLIYNKPFLIYGNKKRGLSRFKTILDITGLQDRLFLDSSDFSQSKIDMNVNWDIINKKIEIEKRKSLDFLKYNL